MKGPQMLQDKAYDYLINKIKNKNQQVIVTTRQKLSIAVKKRIKEDQKDNRTSHR